MYFKTKDSPMAHRWLLTLCAVSSELGSSLSCLVLSIPAENSTQLQPKLATVLLSPSFQLQKGLYCSQFSSYFLFSSCYNCQYSFSSHIKSQPNQSWQLFFILCPLDQYSYCGMVGQVNEQDNINIWTYLDCTGVGLMRGIITIIESLLSSCETTFPHFPSAMSDP